MGVLDVYLWICLIHSDMSKFDNICAKADSITVEPNGMFRYLQLHTVKVKCIVDL